MSAVTGPHSKHTRPRGYRTNYHPNGATQELLADVRGVLDRYRDYLPLTVRQVYYALIGTGKYAKGTAFESRLYEAVGNFRRARLIDFRHIRDDTAMVAMPDCFADENAFYAYCRHLAGNYRRDKQVTQPRYIEVWCEAAGMVPQLNRVAAPYSIPVYSGSGFNSLSEKWQAARRICAESRQAVILHLGDYDSSGEHVYTAVAEDVAAFVAADRPHGLVGVTFERVALTSAQIRQHALPTERVKTTNPVARNWVARQRAAGEVDEACQLEALAPNVIATLLQQAILARLDYTQLSHDREIELEERQRIAYALPAPQGAA